MIDPTTALAAAKKIDEAVGLIGKLAGKLKAKPDLAAQKLAQTLEEIAKTLQVVDNAVSSFLSLGIDVDALEKNSKMLLDIEGGGLSTAVERGRGHCHVISNIHGAYLDRWFNRVLRPNDYQAVSHVFAVLGSADADMFQALTTLVKDLEKEAGVVLDLVVKGQTDAARARVLGVRAPLRPLRATVAKTMQQLYGLKDRFIMMSGVA